MKKKILLILTLSLILVACGENVSIDELWSDYQGEAFVDVGVDGWSEVQEKDLSGLNYYEFLYLDGNVYMKSNLLRS